MKKNIDQIIIDYKREFDSYVESINETSPNPVYDVIYMAKKYVSKLNLDDITSRELQNFLPYYIESLYRRKFYWNEINDEINEYQSLLDGQYAALYSRTLRYASLSGFLMLLIQPNFLIGAASAFITGIATYAHGKKQIKKKERFKNYIIGTNDYNERLIAQLYNNISVEKKTEKQ